MLSFFTFFAAFSGFAAGFRFGLDFFDDALAGGFFFADPAAAGLAAVFPLEFFWSLMSGPIQSPLSGSQLAGVPSTFEGRLPCGWGNLPTVPAFAAGFDLLAVGFFTAGFFDAGFDLALGFAGLAFIIGVILKSGTS